MGKLMIMAGIILIIGGVLFMIAPKIPGFGKLPGDIFIKKENFTFYFPWVTCILVSIILTLIMRVFNK